MAKEQDTITIKSFQVLRLYFDHFCPLLTFHLGVYNGTWANGEPRGYGEMKWDNGNEYKGGWRDDHWYGNATRKLGNRIYQLEYVQKKRLSKGLRFIFILNYLQIPFSARQIGMKMNLIRWRNLYLHWPTLPRMPSA